MTIETREIRSCDDASCPRPWVVLEGFTVSAAGISVRVRRVNGPAAAEWCPKIDDAVERRLERAHTFKFDKDPELSEERHALAITTEGELIFVPFSKQPPVLYAHLAFVDPITRDATVLSFVNDPEHVAHVKEA